MITAIDSNVFFDVLAGLDQEKLNARTALAATARQGILVASVIVYGELAGVFARRVDLNIFFESWRCAIEPLNGRRRMWPGFISKSTENAAVSGRAYCRTS